MKLTHPVVPSDAVGLREGAGVAGESDGVSLPQRRGANTGSQGHRYYWRVWKCGAGMASWNSLQLEIKMYNCFKAVFIFYEYADIHVQQNIVN